MKKNPEQGRSQKVVPDAAEQRKQQDNKRTSLHNRIKFSDLLPSFLLPAAVFLLILLWNRIEPFGSISLLYSDLDSQYIEFMAEYRRILLGEGSFFWSWHAGMGMNFIGIIAYYLASPFNFLLILFPENQLPLAVSVLTILKISCSGAAFAYFLRRHVHSQTGLISLVSTCYALCTYTMGYAFNIMWLDAIIWLPLLCAGIDHLLSKDKKGMSILIILLSLSFLSQFYMAWMTGAFCALYFFARSCIQKHSFRTFVYNVIRFAFCVGIAAGVSAFLLLPTFFVLKNNMGLIGQEFPKFSGQFSLLKILPKLFAGSFDGIKDCLPHLYCGIAAIPGIFFYFTNSHISKRERIVSGGLLLILLFSFWSAPLDFLWHAMDHPSWFPYRYAFLFCFWSLYLACRGFSEWTGTNDPSCGYVPWLETWILLAAAVFLTQENKLQFLLINGMFTVIYTTLWFILSKKGSIKKQCPEQGSNLLNKNHSTGRKAYLYLIAIPVIFELFINGNLIVSGRINGYTKADGFQAFHEHYRGLTAPVQPAESDFYRMEKVEYRNYNDALGIGYPGVTHFSSTASTRQSEFLKRLGFNCYATWCSYEGATSATDALLRIRYEFWKNGKQDSIQAGDETWEHPAQFPLFFYAGDNFARYDFFTDVNPITRQNDLLQLLEGNDSSDYFSSIPVKVTDTENLQLNENLKYTRIDPSEPAYFEAEVHPVEDKSLYLYFPGASLTHTVTINGTEEMMNGYRDYSSFPICLDAWASDDAVRIKVDATKDTLNGRIEAYVLDTERLAELSKTINEKAPYTERINDTKFILTVVPEEDERLIVSSIPFDAGWQIHADGQRLPLKMIHESVLGFTLPAGTQTVEISFQPYGMKAGFIISGIALMLWLAVFVIERRKRKQL